MIVVITFHNKKLLKINLLTQSLTVSALNAVKNTSLSHEVHKIRKCFYGIHLKEFSA